MKEKSGNIGILFEKLQSWYESQCDGEWEHSYGVSIDTLDNPGWIIKIDLADTEWEEIVVEQYTLPENENDWFHYKVADRKFEATSSIRNLGQILTAFFDIIEKHKV